MNWAGQWEGAVFGEGGGVSDDGVRRMATIVNICPNSLTCFRFLGLCPLDSGTVSPQLPLYLCHFCPLREYAFLVSEARLNLGMRNIGGVRKVLNIQIPHIRDITASKH